MLLDGSGGAVVIDPAWDPDELAAIPADLAALGSDRAHLQQPGGSSHVRHLRAGVRARAATPLTYVDIGI